MKKRKFVSFLLAVCMILTMAQPAAFAETGQTGQAEQTAGTEQSAASAQTFADMSGHWAAAAVSKWAGLGIIKGDSGGFRPDDPITRAEFAVILDNLMDYQVEADNTFPDVAKGAWYEDAILKANAAGILNGDEAGHALPGANVSREQAAVMLARAFGMEESTGERTAFQDASSISGWAKGLVFSMEADRYIGGMENGSFAPKADITRAQVVTILDNAVRAYYTRAGAYTENVAPKTAGANCVAIVRAAGVAIRGAEIAGDLIVAEGVGDGDFTLDGSEVKGNLIVRGGGENSIHVINGADVNGRVTVEKADGIVRIISNGVVIVTLEADAEVILEGEFVNVTVAAGASVEVRGRVEILTVAGKAEIKAAQGARIGTVRVESGAQGTNLDIDKNAEIGRLEAGADMTTSGAGTPKAIAGSGAVTDKETPGSGSSPGGSGGGGNNRGDNGGGDDTTDERSISVRESDQVKTEIAGEEPLVYVDFTGTNTAGESSLEVLSGALTVKDGEALVDAGNYSLDADGGYLSFEPDYIAGLSEGKHIFTYSFKTSDGKTFTASSTLYLIPAHAVILYDQPESCALEVTDNDTSGNVTSGSSVGITGYNSIEIKLSGLPSGKRIKSAAVTNSYYGYTETFDIAYDLVSQGRVQYFYPAGTTTIRIVTEDIPADLPEIAGVEFYLEYDESTDTYGDRVTTEVPAMLPGDGKLLYARILLGNEEATSFAQYAWTQQVIGETTSTTPGSYANFCVLYMPGTTGADSELMLTVSGYDGYTQGSATATILVRKPLQRQSAPANLTAGPVSSTTAGDGKIIGTTAEMEYKLLTADDSAYVTCGAGETTGLALGTYAVRMKAKTGYAAGQPALIGVLMAREAPAGLTGISPTTSLNLDARISGTTTGMEWRSSESEYYGGCAEGTTTVYSPGTYYVRYRAVDGQYYAGEDAVITISPYVAQPNQDQAAPTGLTTAPAARATSSNGKIIGTTTDMEYRLSSAANYTGCGAGETTWLAAGTYLVRYKARAGYNVGADATVTITAPVASSDATLQSLAYSYTYGGAQQQTDVPGFSPSITEYNIPLYGNIYGKTFNLNPYAGDPGYAAVSYSAVTVNAGEYTAVLKAEVTAEDGTTKLTYTVNITVERRSGSAGVDDDVYHINGDTEPVITMVLTDRDGAVCSLADLIGPGGTTGSVAIKTENSYDPPIDPLYYTVDAENSRITIKADYFSGKSGTSCIFNIKVTTSDGYTFSVQEVNAPTVRVEP
jgi:hypothetical protein